MTIQFINDEEGNPQFVVIGYDEYTRLTSYEEEDEEEDESMEYETDDYYYR